MPLLVALILVLLQARTAAQGTTFPPQEHGSVLLIIGDDIAAADLDPLLDSGALPNIAQIAAHGTRFRRAYGNGVCSPSRQSILLGQYHTGDAGTVCGNTGGFPIPLAAVTLPDLEPNAWKAMIGKAHMGRNAEGDWPLLYQTLGFGSWRAGTPVNVKLCLGGPLPGTYNRWLRVDDGMVQDPSNLYEPFAVRDEALAWWQMQAASQPKVLWLTPQLAHGPFHNPPASLLPPGFVVGSGQRAQYEAMIRALDATLGGLLEAVDWENDLVIFVGDNGTPEQVAPDSGRAKTTTFERGINVPLIVSGQGFSANSESQALVHIADIYATVAKHFGRQNQYPMHDSQRLQNPGHATVICTGTEDVCAFDGTVKLRRIVATGEEQLFDLSVDAELTSFLGQPAYAGIEATLRGVLEDYLAR